MFYRIAFFATVGLLIGGIVGGSALAGMGMIFGGLFAILTQEITDSDYD